MTDTQPRYYLEKIGIEKEKFVVRFIDSSGNKFIIKANSGSAEIYIGPERD